MINKDKIKMTLSLLKNESGTHSPSISTILSSIPELKINIDACFLSNPYATDLFMSKLMEVQSSKLFRDYLEYYPPQNYDLAKKISDILDVDKDFIFVGNGAIEVIQACMHRFAGKKVALPIPTFSSYYEFLRPDSKLVWYHLEEKNNFSINLNDFSNFIRNNNVDTAILINPSNPVGTYSKKDEIVDFLRKSTDLDLIILDESFIHFAYEDNELSLINNSALINEFPNLVIIKSMSKDFGIAGIRAGYGIMHSRRVKELLYNGYLWNSSGLANYFFSLYSQVDFRKEYDVVRRKYIMETRNFIDQLATINSIKVFPTMANFALIKIPDEINSFDFTMDLLIDSGIYLRDCKDKVGLSERGGFIRVASRSYVENNVIFNSIRNYFL